MRRLMVAALVGLTSLGLFGVPAMADAGQKVNLSFDFSANATPPSASGPDFHINVDVLPEHASGYIRVLAISPENSGARNLFCRRQQIDRGHVNCKFNFSVAGTWTIKTQYITVLGTAPVASAVTNIRVSS